VNGVDLVILALVLAAVVWGVHEGFVVQVGTYAGLVGGVLLGTALADRIVPRDASAQDATLVGLLVVGVTASVLGALGGVLGAYAQRGLVRFRLGAADAVLGAVVAVAGVLVAVWWLGAALASAPETGIAQSLQRSSVLHWLDSTLPPVPDVMARLGRITDPLGFPRVFAGLEPSPSAPVTGPLPAQVRAAATAAERSTVEIVGEGCGGELVGSGWVAAPDLVVTNAHVVAGIAAPNVSDADGTHRAVPVLFDPDADIAVLRVGGLAGPPLAVAPTNPERGAVGAVLGYPGGGPLTVGSAAVRAVSTPEGRDIYGSGLTRRTVLELQAIVRPGNSGGPFVLPDGRVAGMVFASSVRTSGIGYALAASELQRDLARAGNRRVATGACAA